MATCMQFYQQLIILTTRCISVKQGILFLEISSYFNDAQPHSPKLTGLYPSTHLLVEAPSPSGLKGLAADSFCAVLVCSCYLPPPAFKKMCKHSMPNQGHNISVQKVTGYTVELVFGIPISLLHRGALI